MLTKFRPHGIKEIKTKSTFRVAVATFCSIKICTRIHKITINQISILTAKPVLGIIPNFDVNIKSAPALEPIFHVSKVKFHFNVARATTKRSNRTSRIKLYPTKYSTYLSKASIISRIWCIHSFHTCKWIQGSNQPIICDEVARSRYVEDFCWASFLF